MATATDYVTSMPRVEQERRGCIRTFTGRYVNPLQLRPEDIDIRDIAHHLSLICRYTGACPEHYSVAQHSVYVAEAMLVRYGVADAGLAGLLHDAEEAYLNDIASPVKHDPRMAWYCEIGDQARRMIYEKYKVDEYWWYEKVKAFDDACFQDEVAAWWGGGSRIMPWTPRRAEKRFLKLFDALSERLQLS